MLLTLARVNLGQVGKVAHDQGVVNELALLLVLGPAP